MLVTVLRLLLPVAAPLLFAYGSAIRSAHGTWTWIIWGCGSAAVLIGLLLNEMTISRLQADRLINTAVDFVHAVGTGHNTRDIRANYATRMLFRPAHLKIKHYSVNYGKAELKNTWAPKDRASAIIALERNVVVLGGDPKESLIDAQSINAHCTIEVRNMVYFNSEEEKIKCVLCCPVRRKGKGRPIGVITFDDTVPLRRSVLATAPVIHAAKAMADRGISRDW